MSIRRSLFVLGVAFAAVTTAGAMLVIAPGTAGAGAPVALVVDTLEDYDDFDTGDGCNEGPGDTCGLREAVAVASQNPDGGTITFSVDGVIALDREIEYNNNSDHAVSITGNGVGATIVEVAEPVGEGFRRGGGDFRHFRIWGGNLTLEAMTLRNGRGRGDGGSIWVANLGSLSTKDVHFVDNEGSRGGAIYADGQNETVDIERTTFTGNDAYAGGAVYVGYDTVTIENSTFTANSADIGAAIYASDRSVVTVEYSTFSQNVSTAVEGGNEVNFRSMRSRLGGLGDCQECVEVMSQASTVYGEDSRRMAFLVRRSGLRGGPRQADFSIGHSILEKNTSSPDDEELGECAGAVRSAGANVVDDESCDFTAALDVQGTAANVGDLGDNGGPTFTMALVATSAAVDVDPTTCALNDQRDLPRNADGDDDGTAGCDSGAYELQAAPPVTVAKPVVTTPPPEVLESTTAQPAVPVAAKPSFTG